MGTFLLILKIIGITLAVLIGLVLLIVILILFVPIRYNGNGEYPYTGNKLPADIHGRVSWLLHLVHVSFDTMPEGQILKVKLFGFTIYSNDPATLAKKAEKEKKKQEKLREKKRKKKEKAAAKRKKEKEKRKKKMEANKSKNASQKDKEFKKWDKKHKKDKKKQASTDNLKNRASGKRASDGAAKNEGKSSGNDSLGSLDRAYFDADAAKKLKEEKDALKNEENLETDTSETSATESDKEKKAPRPGSVEYLRQHTGVDDSKKKSEIYEKNVKIFDDDSEDKKETDSEEDSDGGSFEEDEKKSFFEKILDKLKGIVKIPQNIYNKIVGLYRKYRKYKDFIDDSRVRKAVSYVIKKVKLVLKRVLPRKLKGHAVIGMENPGTTGFILAGLSLFYRRWAGHFKIEPDFTQKRIEAQGEFKGRIFLIGIAIPGLKILLNKDVKYLREQLDKIKEDKDESEDSEESFDRDD